MKTLEKWYVWGGKGEAPKNATSVVFSDGSIISSGENPYAMASINSYQEYWRSWPVISAYTLGEKVESKRG